MSESEKNNDTYTIEELKSLLAQQNEIIVAKNKEVEDMNQIYQDFKTESEALEDVLTKQADMFEKQLESMKLQQQLTDANYQQKIIQTKQHYLQLLQKSEIEQEKYLLQIGELKDQLVDNGIEPGKKKKQEGGEGVKEEEENDEESPEKIKVKYLKLKLEVEQKNKAIDELQQDILANKSTLKEQLEMFSTFTKDVEENQTRQEEQMKLIKEKHSLELEKLHQTISEKEQTIIELEDQKGGQSEISIQENELKELVKLQTDKLSQISKDFIDYKVNAEKLLEQEQFSRDQKIMQLQAQVNSLKK